MDNPLKLGGSDNFSLVTRHRLYTTDDFWFEVDQYERVGGAQMLIAHVRVVRWSPSVRKLLHHVWDTFRQCVTAPVFAWGEVDGAKYERFMRSLGFQPLPHNITCVNGESRRLFIHRI